MQECNSRPVTVRSGETKSSPDACIEAGLKGQLRRRREVSCVGMACWMGKVFFECLNAYNHAENRERLKQ